MTEQPRPAALALLESLLNDSAVTEIMVDRPERVFVVRSGQLQEAGVQFASREDVRAAIDAALAQGGVKFEAGQTLAEARLPDDTRVLAALPPTAVDGPCLMVRKVFHSPMTKDRLIEFGAISREAFELLERAILARQTILIAGGTASGKTTLQNILIDQIPATERVITVEDSLDLHAHHPRLLRLGAEPATGLTYAAVIDAAAKLRPDRLIFGELHGAEALSILNLISVGYEGSLLTIHATSPEDALARLEALCLTANSGLGLSEIRYRIATTVNLIATQLRLASGQRRIVQITAVQGQNDAGYVLQPLFQYAPDRDQLEPTGVQPGWF